nr:MAG TPA: hypothetical protein [Caudoviricetes sp.]
MSPCVAGVQNIFCSKSVKRNDSDLLVLSSVIVDVSLRSADITIP